MSSSDNSLERQDSESRENSITYHLMRSLRRDRSAVLQTVAAALLTCWSRERTTFWRLCRGIIGTAVIKELSYISCRKCRRSDRQGQRILRGGLLYFMTDLAIHPPGSPDSGGTMVRGATRRQPGLGHVGKVTEARLGEEVPACLLGGWLLWQFDVVNHSARSRSISQAFAMTVVQSRE